MLHWFIIFEFKHWSSAQNNFSIPPKLTKNAIVAFLRPGSSDVIRCVSFDCFASSQCISYKVSTHSVIFLVVLFSGKCPQMMNYPVTHPLCVMSSRCRRGRLLRWLKTVSSTFQGLDFDMSYYHSLSVDATIMVSKDCPIIGEHVGIVFVTL